MAEVFNPAGRSRKIAFTLAEVLITLGIIGVVAAMTMPVLMSKYRENATMAKLKKFYSVMSQVQLRAIAEYGEVDTWDWVNRGEESNNEIVLNWFNKYFGQFLQSTQIIDKKRLNDDEEIVDDGIVILLADGTVANFGNFGGGYLHIIYYTNYKTFMNDTAVYGKDRFLFGFNTTNQKRFDAYSIIHNKPTSDVNELKYNSELGCYTENPTNSNVYCAKLLQINGWNVPKDYPYRF